MSLITRCPACWTMFRVVPDQLRISEGWVRCGQCAEVFDAARNLQVLTPPVRSAAASLKPSSIPTQPLERSGPPPPVVPMAEHTETSSSESVDSLQAAPTSIDAELEDAGMPQERPDQGLVAHVASSTLLVSAETPPAPPLEDDDALEAVFRPGPVAAQAVAAPARASAVEDPESVLDEDVSFVREARRQAFWRKPLMRFVLLLAALLLLGGLAAQIGLQERDRLASLEPRLKPWLGMFCELAGCKVDVPRQIESVVIENSSFMRVRSDLFRLGFMIRNTAGVEVATPAVELTLTDTQDRPVLRRVFQPAELGSSVALAPKGEWSAVLNLGVASSGDSGRVAGYRLLAFYP